MLLKNNGILPFHTKGKKVAVIGSLGSSTRSLFGGYSYVSVLELAIGGRNIMAGIEVQKDEVWKSQKKDSYPGSMIGVEIPKLEADAAKAYGNCNVRDQAASLVRPERELVGFGTIHLAPGQKKRVAFLDRDMKWKSEAGLLDLLVVRI